MKSYLDLQDVERMESCANSIRDRLLIRLLFHLGCRVSEALGITVSDIDFDQSTVTIVHLKKRIKLSCPQCGERLSRNARFCPGCGHSVEKAVAEEKEHRRQRALPVYRDTMDILMEYMDHGSTVEKNGKQFLFSFDRGYAWRVVKECAQKAGLDRLINPETGKLRGVSPHRLRDAFAVHAVKLDDSGDGLRLLQEHLGHQSISTTLRYRKISGEEHREWYEKLWIRVDERRGEG